MDTVTALFVPFTHWSWWIAALALFLVELLLPGVFFLWLGLAAMVTGFVALLAPAVGWEAEVVVFAVLSVIAAVVGRRFWKPANVESADPTLNRRGAQYVGQIYVLETALQNGHGRLTVGDGTWLVTGPDLPGGASVRVVGVEGARLRVEPA